MSTPKLEDLLERGDRAPNFFLPDQRDIIINLNDKARGGPLFVLLYPTQKDPGALGELQAMFRAAPAMLEAGAHLFAISADPMALVQKIAAENDPGFFLLSDADKKVADRFGARGKLVGFVFGPDQKIRSVLRPGDTPIAERAAAEIAAMDAVVPSPASLHPPILVIPEVFSPSFCEWLIEQFETRGNEPSGTLRMEEGKMVHITDGVTKRRRDHHVVDKDLLEAIGSRIERRVLPEIRNAFHSDIRFVEEFKIVRYDADVGGFFRPHRDNTTLGTAHRRFAMTLNLNTEDHEGGELRFPEYGQASYRPATGEAAIFSCNLLHEATDVTKGQRYTLLSFMYDESGRQFLERYREKGQAT
ncbi:MAG: redoxin domain-containing protein [Rhodospirillaceae bacterium]|jgi:peroxiredoxin/predicted 2-oxoglutarate/Fe(II)-dependent dioxygenase YbiX|nr:redoxin domain-containing protein [Rhodospirillaceae bacterium]MBT6404143.1 redoxin domain-containing protein [Rhodospirillaceae bacterium]MBT6537603.1 redoxin domain-containing protein [Rhodospirillaceae bacterium]MBT7360835.1 redoxin domain-containing protein [Rhodospirillaceae bacterium]